MTPEMLRIGGWFGRRTTTQWSAKELKALKSIGKTEPEDWAILESMMLSFYPYKRKDIATLLNNWPGEIDKARRLAEENGTSVSSVSHECIPLWKYEVMNIIRLTLDNVPEHLKMRYKALVPEAKEYLEGLASDVQLELLKK